MTLQSERLQYGILYCTLILNIPQTNVIYHKHIIIPAFEAIVEIGVVSAEDKNNVKPAFRKEITAMVINNYASISHLVLQLIHNLEY